MTRYRMLQVLFVIVFFSIIAAFPAWVILTWAKTPKGLVVQSEVLETSVPLGGIAHLAGYITVPSGCTVVLFRSVYDSQGTLIGVLNEFLLPVNGEISVKSARDVLLPITSALGTASIHRVVQWSCNWTQQLFPRQQIISTLYFTIVPPTIDDGG